jgi:hypothetical protein
MAQSSRCKNESCSTLMQPERWQQIDNLFHLALAQDPNRRGTFLVQECAGDDTLRTEVEALLASHDQAQNFIESPASDLAQNYSPKTKPH